MWAAPYAAADIVAQTCNSHNWIKVTHSGWKLWILWVCANPSPLLITTEHSTTKQCFSSISTQTQQKCKVHSGFSTGGVGAWWEGVRCCLWGLPCGWALGWLWVSIGTGGGSSSIIGHIFFLDSGRWKNIGRWLMHNYFASNQELFCL